ncbi:hypothetical protein STEG23_008867 [Scotinomys teguina]
MPHISYECTVINTTAKEASLPMAAAHSSDQEHQHCLQRRQGSQISTRPPEAAQTMEVFPENEPFFISNILLLLRVRVIILLDSVSRNRTCKSSRLLHITLPSAPACCGYPDLLPKQGKPKSGGSSSNSGSMLQ